jgi:hydrogenase expression/formation protein HypE
MKNGNQPETITIEHGSGGALSNELVEGHIYPLFAGTAYPELTDATRLTLSGELCMTTDSYTVDPYRFPGSDIGQLAVFGTCNDLAVAGAQPRFLSVGLILEEGFPMADLDAVLASMRAAAVEAGVSVVTGDTKVVPKGKGGGIYINTAGIGEYVAASALSPSAIRAGDSVIVSGPVGAHGIAVMATRERMTVGSEIRSDCAFLYPACRALMELGPQLRFMRDATRGGIAAVVGETASAAALGIDLIETSFPIDGAVSTVAEILGLYPLEIANEGVFIAIVSSAASERALEILHDTPVSAQAAIVGTVGEEHPGRVVLETEVGGRRILDLPRGLLLPRIC